MARFLLFTIVLLMSHLSYYQRDSYWTGGYFRGKKQFGYFYQFQIQGLANEPQYVRYLARHET